MEHNLPMSCMMVSFQRNRFQVLTYDNLQLFVEKFTIHNVSAPYKQGIDFNTLAPHPLPQLL